MDRKKFGELAPGELVVIGGGDVAFVPRPLPPESGDCSRSATTTPCVADVGGHVRLTEIIQGIFTSPFVRVAQLAKRLDVTYPTAKSDIDRLVQAGVLHELPNVTPKTFYAPDVFKVSYGELGNDGHADSDEP